MKKLFVIVVVFAVGLCGGGRQVEFENEPVGFIEMKVGV